MKTEKARICDIYLGDYLIQGVYLPNGEIRVTATQILNLFNPASVASRHQSRDLKNILDIQGSLEKVPLERESNVQNRPEVVITTEQAIEVIYHFADRSHPVALALLKAMATETLERRLHRAF